jgi:hypothetical protein
MRVPLATLGFRRTTIHFCICRQAHWQEYSEFSNSALLSSSAPGSGMNRQLGIFRNSEYLQYSVNGILSVSCTDPIYPRGRNFSSMCKDSLFAQNAGKNGYQGDPSISAASSQSSMASRKKPLSEKLTSQNRRAGCGSPAFPVPRRGTAKGCHKVSGNLSHFPFGCGSFAHQTRSTYSRADPTENR